MHYMRDSLSKRGPDHGDEYQDDNIYLGASYSYLKIDGPSETVSGTTFNYSDIDIYKFSSFLGYDF